MMSAAQPSHASEPVPSLVEVGNFVLIARIFPEISAWYWMGRQRPGPVAAYQRRLTLPNVYDLRRMLAAESTRMAFVHVPIRSRRPIDQGLVRMLHGDFGRLAFREVLRVGRWPLVGLDFNDDMEMSDTALKVLERCVCYFKRELPADFHRLLPRRAGEERRRMIERNAHKLLPTSLGISADRVANLPQGEQGKVHDIFFSGDTNTPVRKVEHHLLAELEMRNVRVFRPGVRLSQPEFFKCCAQSWLVWSPEGAGWDCFRHYEAAACGSVPVMNAPSIRPYLPLVHGEHALYYRSEVGSRDGSNPDFAGIKDGLIPTVLRALEDRGRLGAMGGAARSFALEHHTHGPIIRGILREAEARCVGQGQGQGTA